MAAEFSKLICLLPVSVTAQNTALISPIYRFTVCSSLSFLGLAAAFPINPRVKQQISLLHIICQQSPFMVWKYFIILFAVWLRPQSPLDLVSFLWKVLDISVSLRYTITVLRAKLNKKTNNKLLAPKTIQSLVKDEQYQPSIKIMLKVKLCPRWGRIEEVNAQYLSSLNWIFNSTLYLRKIGCLLKMLLKCNITYIYRF